MSRILNFRIHSTWILIFALVTAIVTTQFSEDYPLLQRTLLGLSVSLLFLLFTIIRELIFSLIIFHREIPVRKITLFAFGAVYPEIKGEIIPSYLPLLYLARFLSNLVIAAIFYGLYATFINAENLMLAGAAQWLTYIYILLFLLHFIPAFPLDGGQILRTLIWKSKGDYHNATYLAALIGWAIGLFMIFAGVLAFIVSRQWIISLLIIFLGWIIAISAGNIRRYIRTSLILRKIQTEDIMTTVYPVMPRYIKVEELVRERILVKGWRYIIVVDGTQLKGILTLDRIKSIPVKRWNNISLGDIMTPSDQLITAHPQQTADALFEEMYQRNIEYIPVLKDNSVVGVVTRPALLDLVKIHLGFGI